MAKRKLPFIRLSIVFLFLILASLFYSWGYHKSDQESGMMMDASMGDMMGENHLKDITIRDLIVVQEEQSEAVLSEDSMASHHESGDLIQSIHKITTITIVALLPFIIAGTIFLIIVWFDKS